MNFGRLLFVPIKKEVIQIPVKSSQTIERIWLFDIAP